MDIEASVVALPIEDATMTIMPKPFGFLNIGFVPKNILSDSFFQSNFRKF